MTSFSPTRGGYDTSPVAGGDKPYRVYRGGRARGSVPLTSKEQVSAPRKKAVSSGRNGVSRYPGPGPSTRRRRPRWRTLVLLGVLVLFVLFVVWAVASYLYCCVDRLALGPTSSPRSSLNAYCSCLSFAGSSGT